MIDEIIQKIKTEELEAKGFWDPCPAVKKALAQFARGEDEDYRAIVIANLTDVHAQLEREEKQWPDLNNPFTSKTVDDIIGRVRRTELPVTIGPLTMYLHIPTEMSLPKPSATSVHEDHEPPRHTKVSLSTNIAVDGSNNGDTFSLVSRGQVTLATVYTTITRWTSQSLTSAVKGASENFGARMRAGLSGPSSRSLASRVLEALAYEAPSNGASSDVDDDGHGHFVDPTACEWPEDLQLR